MIMDTEQKVYDKLDELKISYELIHHIAVYTVEEMAEAVPVNNEHIVKNLFLRDEKGRTHFLVVLEKHKKADLKNIRSQLGCSTLSFASEERLWKYLRLTKGAVTPLGILNDDACEVKVVFDKDLVGKEKIGIHPNVNTATVFLSYADLKKVIEHNGNEICFVEI